MHTRSKSSLLSRLLLVMALVALTGGLGVGIASADPPEFTFPERVYSAVDVPVPFAGGDDPISGDPRKIELTSALSAGCNPVAPDYFLTGCARVQLSVTHGEIQVAVQELFTPPTPREGIAQGGAILDSSENGDGSGLSINLNGTQAQLNAALATLVFTPDSGYRYNGSNQANLDIVVVHNDNGTETTTEQVQIRIQEINDGPTLTVPAGPYDVAAASTTTLEPDPPPGTEDLGLFFVEDPDVEEETGLDERMLLIMFTTCGEFELRGGSLTLANDIEQLLTDAGLPQEFITPVMAALPAEVTGRAFATGNPADPHEALAGIGDFDEVNYALSSVDFIAPAAAGSCELWTIVHDLGNQGLPWAYIGSPPTGFEVPALLGLDVDDVTFVVDGGVEVSLPPAVSVAEGAVADLPLTISGTDHPGFEVALTSTGGSATLATDFTAAPSPIAVLEAAPGPIPVTAATLQDPEAEGPETFTVAIDPASLPDGVTVGNGTTTVTVIDDDGVPDTTAPTVTVNQGATQPDPTATSPIVYDVVFSEPVTGLTPADFSSTGTTAGGLLTLTLTGGPTTWTATIAGMTTAGNVVLTLPAGAAQDAANNTSAASTAEDNTVIWAPPPPDTTGPTVTVNQGATQPDPTATSPIVYDVVFSEPVTGLTPADFSSTGTTAGGLLTLTLTGGPTTWTATIAGMTTAGNVVLTLPAGAAQDAANNFSAASTAEDNTVIWAPPPPDTTSPTVTVNQGATQPDPTATAPITYDIVFSEPVTGLTPADFSSTGTTAGGLLTLTLTGGPTTWTATIAGMTTAGNVVLTLPAGAAQDAANNTSAASTAEDNTVIWAPPPPDTTGPTVTVNQGATQPDPTATSPIVYDVVFSEPVTGLTPADFSSTGTTAGGLLTLTLTGGPTTWTATIAGMTTAGNVVLTLPAGAAQDAASNPSAASTATDNTVIWAPPPPDTTSPTVTVNQGATQPDPTSTAPITYDIVFSEPVTGLLPAEFSTTDSTAGGALAVTLTGGPTTWTATVTGMTTDGDVVLTLPAGAAVDAAANASAASTSTDNTVIWEQPDTVGPTVTVNQGAAQADPTADAPIVFDIVFSEPVFGLEGSDFGTGADDLVLEPPDDLQVMAAPAGGTLLVTVAGAGTTWTAAVTGMTTAGQVSLSLPAGAAVDAAGNPSAASTSTDNTVTWAPPAPPTTDPTGTGGTPTTGTGASASTSTSTSTSTTDTSAAPTTTSTGSGAPWRPGTKGSLAHTGADAQVQLALAIGLLLVGGALLMVSRRGRISGRHAR